MMDEAVLNTSNNADYRRYIRDHFIIRAVISLPKNTFVRADSSVKTSILYLVKKTRKDTTQPGIFMAVSNSVGHTDSGRDDPGSSDLDKILDNFKRFRTWRNNIWLTKRASSNIRLPIGSMFITTTQNITKS